MGVTTEFTARRALDGPEYIRNDLGKQVVPHMGVVFDGPGGQQFGMDYATFTALYPDAGYNATTNRFDNEALAVSETTPTDEATDVAVDATVEIVFNKTIDSDTVDATNITVLVGETPVAGSFAVVDDTVTFTPGENLTNEATVDVTVTTDVTDEYGLSLASAYEFSFTVVAA